MSLLNSYANQTEIGTYTFETMATCINSVLLWGERSK